MKKLGQGAIGTGAGTLAYTVPAGMHCELTNIDICNTTSGVLALSFHLVAAGGAASTSNMLVPAMNLAPNSMFQWTGLQVMSANDFIQVIGSGSGLTMHITGDEIR